VGVDALLAVSLATTMVVELSRATGERTEVTPLAVAVIVAATLPLFLRHTRPVLALVLATALLYAVMATVDIYQTVPFPCMVVGYSLALTLSRRTTLLAGLALVPFVVAAILVFGHGATLATVTEIPKNLAFVAAPLLLGSAVRERRAAHQALVDRAETAERTREEEALRRVDEERLRIARDVHDVVAHAMVAINVQAGVGAHLLDRDPEQARRTLDDIKQVSGQALADLRATLGGLRPAEHEAADAAPIRPAPQLGALADLGERLRSAGLEVDFDIDPGVASLPMPVASTGYRIVQEALTNVVRHACGSRAGVRVACDGDRVVIRVSNDRRAVARPAPPPLGSGHGVRGMRERAQAAGGTLEAGPDEDGGWSVVATLPTVPLPVGTAPS
jgi:signal transduction histidine kinase